jgi:hypothetical protein
MRFRLEKVFLWGLHEAYAISGCFDVGWGNPDTIFLRNGEIRTGINLSLKVGGTISIR